MTTIFDSLLDQALRSLPLTPLKRARAAVSPSPSPAAAGRYERFISIDVRHEFYNRSDSMCRDIVIAPTPRTRERLALYGYVVRQRSDGVDLFWDLAVRAQANGIFAGLQARFGQVPEDVWRRLYEPPLLFTLQVTNPHFAVFTDMPSDHRIGDPPLRLSTRAIVPGAEGNASLTVDWDKRLARPSIVETHGMEGIGTSAPADEQVQPPLTPAEQGPAAQERARIERRSQALALLDLHFTRADPAPFDGWDGMPVDRTPTRRGTRAADFFRPVTYTIGFAARRTRWRYFIAARNGKLDAASLGIIDATGRDAGFTLDETMHSLPDGRAAACLAGETPRAILSSPQAQLALTGRPLSGRSHSRTLVDRLPGADAESITPVSPPPEAGAAPPAWSDIYVFV